MTAAISQVIDFVFGENQLHRLEANIQPNNSASLALVRKLGFRKEGFSERYLFVDGQWRDHERWALTAEDRQPPSELRDVKSPTT
jgi:ribosomal-protein-alanine N-acetyltransferase